MSKLKQFVSVGRKKDFISYELINIDNYICTPGERLFQHSYLLDSFRKIMGKTLTVIDASISDSQQNKAMKDLVRAIFSEEMDSAVEWGFDQKEMEKIVEESTSHMSDEEIENIKPVSIEEVLGVE